MAATVGMAIGQNSDVTAEAAGVMIMDNSLEKVDEFHAHLPPDAVYRPSERSGRHGAERHRHGLRRTDGVHGPVGAPSAGEVIDILAVFQCPAGRLSSHRDS